MSFNVQEVEVIYQLFTRSYLPEGIFQLLKNISILTGGNMLMKFRIFQLFYLQIVSSLLRDLYPFNYFFVFAETAIFFIPINVPCLNI